MKLSSYAVVLRYMLLLYLVAVRLACACREAAWRFSDASSAQQSAPTPELTLMFAGKPDKLTLEVLTSDNPGTTLSACTRVCLTGVIVRTVYIQCAHMCRTCSGSAVVRSQLSVCRTIVFYAGESSIIDLSAAMIGSPLAQRRKQHNPKTVSYTHLTLPTTPYV